MSLTRPLFALILSLVVSIPNLGGAPATAAQENPASLALSPRSAKVNPGCSFTVDIVVDTGGVPTDGTDAVLRYDPTTFQALAIQSGGFYPTVFQSIDNQVGKVSVSGISLQRVAGEGVLASLTLLVREQAPAGKAELEFVFDRKHPDRTTDSNVVAVIGGTIQDILGSARTARYKVSDKNDGCDGG